MFWPGSLLALLQSVTQIFSCITPSRASLRISACADPAKTVVAENSKMAARFIHYPELTLIHKDGSQCGTVKRVPSAFSSRPALGGICDTFTEQFRRLQISRVGPIFGG